MRNLLVLALVLWACDDASDSVAGDSGGGSDASLADTSGADASAVDAGAADASGIVDGGSGDGAVGPDPDTGAAPPLGEATFGPCDGLGDGLLCTQVDLPLHHGAPDDDRTLSVRVLFLPAAEPPARGQVWLLNGGPGGAAAGLSPLMVALHQLAPTFDVFAPEQRGAGTSTPLHCQALPPDLAFMPAGAIGRCGRELIEQWGDDLAAFSATAQAQDVAELMGRAARDDADVVLWGGSYGAYLAHRVLQIAPTVADRVVFSGPAHLLGYRDLLQFTLRTAGAGDRLLEACTRDPFCGEKFGPNARTRALQVLSRVESGRCEALAGLGVPFVRNALGAALRTWQMRELIPAFLYRVGRCEPGDVAVLERVQGLLAEQGPPTFADSGISPALLYHIGFSEVWGGAADPEAVAAEHERQVFVDLSSMALRTQEAEAWPRYAPPADLQDRFAAVDLPMLFLHGVYDDLADYEDNAEALEHYPQAKQVLFHDAGHVPELTSPLVDGLSCGALVLADFLNRPDGPLDVACVEAGHRPDFRGDPETVRLFVPHGDIWDDP